MSGPLAGVRVIDLSIKLQLAVVVKQRLTFPGTHRHQKCRCRLASELLQRLQLVREGLHLGGVLLHGLSSTFTGPGVPVLPAGPPTSGRYSAAQASTPERMNSMLAANAGA